MSELVEVSVSKASSRQRCGRAGRVREGVCFRLFSRPMYDRLSNYSIPEMLRVPLEELCLHIMVRITHTAPTYLSRHIEARVSERTLRSSAVPLLDKPFTRTDYTRRAVHAPTVWNSLPETIISADSLSVFKSRLKMYFFRKAFE